MAILSEKQVNKDFSLSWLNVGMTGFSLQKMVENQSVNLICHNIKDKISQSDYLIQHTTIISSLPPKNSITFGVFDGSYAYYPSSPLEYIIAVINVYFCEFLSQYLLPDICRHREFRDILCLSYAP